MIHIPKRPVIPFPETADPDAEIGDPDAPKSAVYSVYWSTDRSPKRQALIDAGIISLAHRLAEAFWLYLNLTAALALLWYLVSPRRRAEPFPYQLTCVVVLPMLLLSLVHLFIEVQPRYHMPYVPLLCTLSALGLQVLRKCLPLAPKRA